MFFFFFFSHAVALDAGLATGTWKKNEKIRSQLFINLCLLQSVSQY
jgi:hypothetical protein